MLSSEDESLNADENIDPSEVADLAQDMRMHDENIIPDKKQYEDENLNENHRYYSNQEDSEDNPDICGEIDEINPNGDMIDGASELISEDENQNDEPMDKEVDDANESIPDDTEVPNESGEEAPLVKNPDEDSRPSRDRRAPNCYNPDTSLSYAQKIANHNIVCQHVERNC